MFEIHGQFPDQAESKYLWRYMNTAQYADLLQTSELHLSRADSFSDPWEGAPSPVNHALRPDLYGERFEVMAPGLRMLFQHARTYTFINCWYAADIESAAMWSLYDREGRGVAVRTTPDRLQEALKGPQPVYGTKVRYVDYNIAFIPENNVMLPYVYKRASFKHEDEYRLIRSWSPKALRIENDTVVESEPDGPPGGLREETDLEMLVEHVFVSPEAPPWVVRVIERLTDTYRGTWDVSRSEMGVDPVF
jgi:hypothetical protein